MNNFQQELPKEKRIFKHKSEVQEMVIQINNLVQQGKFTSAYNLIEKCKKHLNSRAYYTDEQRDLLRATTLNAIEKELKTEIRREYFEALKFYSNNYSIIELKKSPYPDDAISFIKFKAKDMLMEKYNNCRFGGYMHVIINKIANECNDELNNTRKQTKKINQVKAIKPDSWER